MTNTNDSTNKDERGLEALLAAAFRLGFPEEISDEQAEKLFQRPVRLSPEDKEVCQFCDAEFIEKIIEGQKTNSGKYEPDIIVNEELTLECYAMNRSKNGIDMDEDTRRKIDEERKKVLEEENNKENTQNNES